MRSKAHTNKFVTVPVGEYHGVYELTAVKEMLPPDQINHRPMCLCCQQQMVAVFDVLQMGFWQDHCNTYFACPSCKKAIQYVYDLSRIEPTPKRAKKSGTK